MTNKLENNTLTNSPRTLVFAAVLALLTGCAGTPRQVDMLDQANESYTEANQTVLVAKHAALELDSAKRELDKANYVWKKGEKKPLVEHHAYLASQRVQIAVHRADQVETDSNIERMKVERQEVQIDARVKEANRAKREALELQKRMAELQAEETERGLVMTLGDMLFETGAAQLAPGAAIAIVKVASFLKQYPEKTASVEGHTDSMGDVDSNFDLSVKRASAVRFALIARGVDADRLTTKGYGEASPIASNDTSSGRRQNRRVEIVFGK